MPDGYNQVILDGFDTQGPATLEGVAEVSVTDTKPIA